MHFEDWAAEFDKIDIVISSTSAPHFILDRARLEPLMKLRRNRPLLLIDIAVPRDIEPDVNFMENVYLYNIDDLQAIADNYLQQRKEEIIRCEKIIREKAEALLGARPQTGAPASRPKVCFIPADPEGSVPCVVPFQGKRGTSAALGTRTHNNILFSGVKPVALGSDLWSPVR